MRALCFPLIFLATASAAQSWCPPGASWNFEELSIGFTGYRHRVYEGDTIVLGQNAQRIRTTGMRVDLLLQDTVWIDQVQYTSLQNDVLMVTAWSPNGVSWDTLLRFDAVPGDRWYLPNYHVYCNGQEPYGMLQVTDTGHVTVDGVILRNWSTGIVEPNGQVIWSGISYYERIGFLGGLIPYPFCGAFIEKGELLKCYWDAGLTFLGPGSPPGTTCDITLGAPSPASTHGITVAPNPGREQLMLSLPASSHRVDVIDAHGRTIITHANLSGSTAITTAHLPSGPYLIQVAGADGSRTSLRWVKE